MTACGPHLSTAGRHCCRVPWRKIKEVHLSLLPVRRTPHDKQPLSRGIIFFVKYSNEADPEIFFEKKKNVQHTLTRFSVKSKYWLLISAGGAVFSEII